MSELQPRSFRYLEEEGIGTITLNRPDRLNALTFEVYAELRDFFVTLADRGSLKVVIITGEGRGFCSGGDVDAIIGALLKQDMTELLTFTRMTGALIANIRALPKPVIAAINGVAAGAGAVIALASDFRIAVPQASLAFLFTKVGLAGADMGAAYLLPRVVGLARATELLMLGEKVSAEEALAHRTGQQGGGTRVADRRGPGACRAPCRRTVVRARNDQDTAEPGTGHGFRVRDRSRGAGSGDLHASPRVPRRLRCVQIP